MPVTIRDLAEHLGVSQATVSRALGGKLVSSETIARVREAAAALGYQPNVGAQIMATGRTGVYGLLLARAANPYYGRVIEAMQARAFREGRQLTIGCYRGDIVELAQYLELFATQRRTDGIILFPMHDPAQFKLLSQLRHRGVPIVMMGRTLIPHLHYVNVDHEAGWHATTQHLLQLGHRRIGVIMDFIGRAPADAQTVTDARHAGVMHAFHEAGLEWDPREAAPCESSLASGYEAALKLLDAAAPPTAILAGNDLLAMAVTSAARRLGLRIPEDLSVTGYDNTEFATFFDLTTVDNLTEEILEAPFDVLNAAGADGAEGHRIERWVRPQLVVRGSTAPPREG